MEQKQQQQQEPPQPPSPQEIDGRIQALVAQRNAAMDQNVLANGLIAKLNQTISEQAKKIEELLAEKDNEEETKETIT